MDEDHDDDDDNGLTIEMIDNQHCAFGHPSFFSWNPEDSSANDNEALLVEKEDSPPTVGVPEPERYLPR